MKKQSEEIFDIYLTEMGIGLKERKLIIDKFVEYGKQCYIDGIDDQHETMIAYIKRMNNKDQTTTMP